MLRSKYLLASTVVVAFLALACYPKTPHSEDIAPQDSATQPEEAAADTESEAPLPRSPLRVNSFDYQDATGKLTIAGIALPGNELYLYFDDQPLAKVTPDDAGQWSIASDLQLGDGRHTLRAEQYDPTTRMLAARAVISIERAKQPAEEAPKTP
jgi:hypothetical protein